MPKKSVWLTATIFFLMFSFCYSLEFEVLEEKHSIIEHEILLKVKANNKEKTEKFFDILADNILDVEFEILDNKKEMKKEGKKTNPYPSELRYADKNKMVFVKKIDFDYDAGDEEIVRIKYKTTPVFENGVFKNNGKWSINPISWWNNNWNHREKIIVKSSGFATGHNFLITIDENTSPLINYFRRADCGDLRITDQANTQELKYAVVYCDANKALVWVRSDLNAGDNNFWLYYNNPFATTTSDFNNTFHKVDDFEDETLTNPNWNGTLSHFSATGKRLNITTWGVTNIYLNVSQFFSGISTLYPKKSGLFFSVYMSDLQQTEVNLSHVNSGESGFAIQEGRSFRCYYCSQSVLHTSNYKPGLTKMFISVDKDGNFFIHRDGDYNIFTTQNFVSEPGLSILGVYKNGYTGAVLDNIFVSKTYLDLNVSFAEQGENPSYESFFTNYYTTNDDNSLYNKKVYYEFYENCQNNYNIRVDLNENNNLLSQNSFVCSGFTQKKFEYTFLTQEYRTLSLITHVDNNVVSVITRSFYFDWEAPQIDANFKEYPTKLNIKMRCSDNFNLQQKYTIKHNNITHTYNVLPNNSLVDININYLDGLNVFSVQCEDFANNSNTKSFESHFYSKKFYFVYNKTGVALTGKPNYVSADINSLYVFNTDNNSYQDMYGPGSVSYQYETTNKNTNIYFLLTYNSQGLASIKNDFDIDVIQDGNIPICFENLQSFNEQRFVSSTKRKIILQNTTSKCYYFGSRTKYAIGDYYYVNAYLTPASYDLWIEDDKGEMQKISLVIGDQPQQINIDSLLLKTKEYQVIINNEHLGVRSACINNDCNALIIRYYNARQDNNSLVISIYRNMEQLYYFSANDANVNDAIVLVNTSDWNVGYDTFEIRASTKKQDGKTNLIKFYYNFKFRKSTQIDPSLILIGSFLIVFVGLTLVSAKASFGWFGIIILLIGLFISTFTKQEWYITLFQAILLIILLFTMLIYRGKSEYS